MTATTGTLSHDQMSDCNYRQGISTGHLRWARDLADDVDPVVVDRLVAGDQTETGNAWERREAVRRLRARGDTYSEISARLNLDEQQIWRDLTRAGMTQPLNDDRARVARQRRQLIPSLIAAGAGRVELARLFNVSLPTIGCDLNRLGLRIGPRNRYTSRGRAELLATYGHLLCQPEGATG